MKLESWEREPFWLKLITPYLRKKRFPELKGEPVQNEWYRIYAEGCVSANGEPIYADFQKGKENKLMIFFQGGGVSWNEYTAARPSSLYQKNIEDSFYMIHVDLFSDLTLKNGVFENSNRNGFKDWSKLVIPYCTGDFHSGTGDFPYVALDGSNRLCHHHGYTNFVKLMEKVTKMVDNPNTLLVTGCSGGGFGAALLTDTICKMYPKCEDVTCLVDSGFFPMDDWKNVAKNVWQSPKEIIDRIHSDNITLDALEALERDYHGKIRILLTVSNKDGALARMVNLLQNGRFEFSRESGEKLKVWLKQMMKRVKHQIPSAQIYIFDIPSRPRSEKVHQLTKHCIISDKEFYDFQVEGKSCSEWLWENLTDSPSTVGLTLLD
ncbi:TPA: hypothetical protein TXJ12_000508 [Streptococcus suis]|nr:hypothetical protein [Streptococcus suis]HEL1906520.1 hypothetical protein [Streptococcus suis]HEL2725481.1 hypothetical protein [Streptococcus suis]HEM2547333.1 hypothetical protein [Streptococcus suis]